MKKIVLIISMFLLSISLFGQSQYTFNLPKYDLKKYHFGFLLAYNQFDFAIKPYTNLSQFDSLMVVESNPQSGFNLGIISDLRLGDHFNLRFTPTLSFGDRILKYTILYHDTISIDITKTVESTYLDFPLLLKFKSSRMNNTRVYIIGGVQYSIDLASQAKKTNELKDEILVKLIRDDISVRAGIGLDFYFNFFKFSTEFTMTYGLKDLIDREGNLFSNSIERLNAKNMQISLLFE